MTGPNEGAGQLPTVLAFWRTDTSGETEFFVPIQTDYLSLMRFSANGQAGASARRHAATTFGVTPRNNARIFPTPTGRIVAFTLTAGEAAELNRQGHGAWLPTRLMDPLLGAMLQDVANRL